MMAEWLQDGDFRSALEREALRAVRYSYFLSVLLMQLDQGGDLRTMAMMAGLVGRSLRRTDLIGRIRSDRFSAILHHAEPEGIGRAGERIRRGAAALCSHPRSKGRSGRTVSIGGVCFPAHTSEPLSMLTLADTLLKRARAAGGNRVLSP